MKIGVRVEGLGSSLAARVVDVRVEKWRHEAEVLARTAGRLRDGSFSDGARIRPVIASEKPKRPRRRGT